MMFSYKLYVGGPDEDQKFIDVRMNAIKRKILVLSGKGGTFFMFMIPLIAFW